MSITSFFKLVEIQTKIASAFPFLIGVLFTMIHFDTLNIGNTVIFFLAMLLFGLTTTTINNYMDYKKATDNHDFDYRKERNVIGRENIPVGVVVGTIFTMLILASGLGIWLVFRTDALTLAVGMLCFAIGIFYTFGPIPLSRMPLGEAFSGITMGFGIAFLVIYANVYHLHIASILWQGTIVNVRFDLIQLGTILLISLPAILTIANLMLANNICDLEEDVRNHRYTLPYYLGRKLAILLFQAMYYGSYVAILIAVLLEIYHPIMLLTLLTCIPVQKNLLLFRKKQVKSETFVVSVKNLVFVNGAIVVGLLITVLIR